MTVIKLGGAVLEDPEGLMAVWEAVGAMAAPPILVHGGGPQTTALARRLGHEPRIVAGRRVTTALDLDVILFTLRGTLNARLVASAQAAGIRAVGLSGIDGGLVRVVKRPPRELDGEPVDFGHVGDVVGTDPSVLRVLRDGGFVPVIASPCSDGRGHLFNVNADTVAMEVAAATGATRLELVTATGGIRRDVADPASVCRRLTRAEAEAGVHAGWIGGGMLPKLDVALSALERGISAARIVAPAGIADPRSGTTIVRA